jgi:predicted dehydrogenase
MMIHDFDMARWMLGEEPSSIHSRGSCLVDPEIGRLGDIDMACVTLVTPSGKQAVILNSRRCVRFSFQPHRINKLVLCQAGRSALSATGRAMFRGLRRTTQEERDEERLDADQETARVPRQ